MQRVRRTRGGDHVAGGKRIRSVRAAWLLAAGLFAGSIFVSAESAADWDVYVSAGLGISTAVVDTDGESPNAPGPILLFGSDDDSSPLVDGAVGLAIPMDELVPREWLLDVRLPNWPVRFELEAAGLREFELKTERGAGSFFTSVKATTLLVNQWLDIPLIEMWRPVQYLGGLGRQPRLRQWLEPGSFFLGWGIGLSVLEIDGSDNVALSGSDDIYDFAWNVGTGVNYALTDKVDLSIGYRYLGLGKQKIDLDGGGAPVGGDVEFDPDVHEFRVQIRVEVYDFRSPWR